MAMPPMRKRQRLYEPPKHIREVPGYLWRVVSGFFIRLFYIIGLVWETSPFLLIVMSLLCIGGGLIPIWGAVISKDLLNAVNEVLSANGIHVEESIVSSFTGVLSGVAFFIILQFVFQLLKRLIVRLQVTVNSLAGEMVSNHIKIKLMNKAKTVDLASYDNPQFYEKLENANREAGIRPISILSSAFDIISSVISCVGFIVLLANIGWVAPVAILLLAAPTAIINYVFRNRKFWYMRMGSKERRQLMYYSDVVTNKDLVKEMRLMNLSDTFIAKYETTFQRYFKGLKKLIVQEGFWQIIGALISLLAEGVLFFYVAYNVVKGNLTVGDYSMYAGALTSIGGFASTIIAATATIYEGTLFIENVRAFMKEEAQIVSRQTIPEKVKKHAPHTVTFEGVSFRYPGTDVDVIQNFNATIHPGEKVVLVGLNGAGKTTLIKLVTRLYDPTEGRILLDGVDIRNYEPSQLYSIFGIIFQDFGKYAITVGENIALGNVEGGYDLQKVKEAAKRANISEYIESLPNGYDTPLMRWFEENGTEFSIGQWQKLSIARAFYGDNDILILDEPTASLDALAEQEIFDEIAALAQDKTVIFVSHRLSSATTADKILVVDGGRLVEVGSHGELMEKGGIYHQLFTTQASHYLEEMPASQEDVPNHPSRM